MKALAAQLLCGLVLCTAMGWAMATAEADFAMANPFLSGADASDAADAADDAAGAELEMRAERFRLEREAAPLGAGVLPALLFVETAADTATTAAKAATAATATSATTTAAPAAAKASAPVASAAATPALVEAASASAKPQPSSQAPFMPGYDENAAPEPVAASAPLPPPAPVSLDTLKMAAEAPVASSASAKAASVADVTEDEAADLLAQVSAVIAGDVPRAHAPSGSGSHRFRALHAAHTRRRAAANAPGYGAPGVRDRKKSHRHHHHNRRHHARNHRSRHHRRAHTEEAESEAEDESFPRFAVKTESDLVAEARSRAASLLAHEQHSAEESLHSMNTEYEGADANSAEAVREKRNEYAAHSSALEHHLHQRFVQAHAHADADTEVDAEAEAETETDAEAEAEAEHSAEDAAEVEGDAEAEGETEVDADAQAQADAETEAQLELEAEEAAKAKAEAEAKAKAAAAAAAAAAQKQAAAQAANAHANKLLLGARFAQTQSGVKSRHRMRMRAGMNAAPGYGPPLHAPPDTHGSPPVMSSTVDLPLNRPPTPNYFMPPTANPPPAAIQTPRLPSLNPNPAPFAPQFPNADAYRSHQLNPYGQFQQIAPPMQREPAASLYPPYSSIPNFEQPAPRSGLQIDLPEPAGGAPSLVEWAAAVHRNTHFDAAAAQSAAHATADRPITEFAGFSGPLPNAPAGF